MRPLRLPDVGHLDRLLLSEGAGEFVVRPVGRAVSNARNEGAALIEPLPQLPFDDSTNADDA